MKATSRTGELDGLKRGTVFEREYSTTSKKGCGVSEEKGEMQQVEDPIGAEQLDIWSENSC